MELYRTKLLTGKTWENYQVNNFYCLQQPNTHTITQHKNGHVNITLSVYCPFIVRFIPDKVQELIIGGIVPVQQGFRNYLALDEDYSSATNTTDLINNNTKTKT
jgi:hypothetical protein